MHKMITHSVGSKMKNKRVKDSTPSIPFYRVYQNLKKNQTKQNQSNYMQLQGNKVTSLDSI